MNPIELVIFTVIMLFFAKIAYSSYLDRVLPKYSIATGSTLKGKAVLVDEYVGSDATLAQRFLGPDIEVGRGLKTLVKWAAIVAACIVIAYLAGFAAEWVNSI